MRVARQDVAERAVVDHLRPGLVLLDDLARAVEIGRAMKGFRNAVLAYGESIKSFLANRTHTTQKKRVPDEALTQFNKLITFTNEGRQYNLTPAFQDAIDATAKLESDKYAPAQG